MADIALTWDNTAGRADFAFSGGDIVMDDGLVTAVILSLFCDAQADPSDVIPDGSTDRRGWWAGPIGSKLWLLPKLQIDDTLRQAEAYASDALAWMIAEGIAESVIPVATFPARGRIQLAISIRQGAVSTVYDLMWAQT